MNDTIVTIVGNLVTDVRLGNTKGDGTPVASFRLAHTSRRFNREHQAWVDGETDYYTVSCWRQMAENVATSLRKGDPVVVFGRQRLRDWQRDERRGTTVEVEAQAVGHDLSRGVSSFERKRRGQAPPSEVGELAEQLARQLDAESPDDQAQRGRELDRGHFVDARDEIDPRDDEGADDEVFAGQEAVA